MEAWSREQLDAALLSRHGAAAQARFAGACVGIAGLGGLGSHIAVHLARLGVGRLILADFDRVDLTNLNRQHYFLPHVGQYKTQALAGQLREINPYLDYETHTVRVTEENACEIFAPCGVVCEAFDRPEEKAMFTQAVLTGLPGVPLVAASGMGGSGSANKIATARPMANFYLCGDGESGIETGAGLMSPRVGVCAAHQAVMVMRLLLGEREP